MLSMFPMNTVYDHIYVRHKGKSSFSEIIVPLPTSKFGKVDETKVVFTGKDPPNLEIYSFWKMWKFVIQAKQCQSSCNHPPFNCGFPASHLDHYLPLILSSFVSHIWNYGFLFWFKSSFNLLKKGWVYQFIKPRPRGYINIGDTCMPHMHVRAHRGGR